MSGTFSGSRHATVTFRTRTVFCQQPRLCVCWAARSTWTRLQAAGPHHNSRMSVRHRRSCALLYIGLVCSGQIRASQATENLTVQDPPLAGFRLAVAAHEIPHPAKVSCRAILTCHILSGLSASQPMLFIHRLHMVGKMLFSSVSKVAQLLV